MTSKNDKIKDLQRRAGLLQDDKTYTIYTRHEVEDPIKQLAEQLSFFDFEYQKKKASKPATVVAPPPSTEVEAKKAAIADVLSKQLAGGPGGRSADVIRSKPVEKAAVREVDGDDGKPVDTPAATSNGKLVHATRERPVQHKRPPTSHARSTYHGEDDDDIGGDDDAGSVDNERKKRALDAESKLSEIDKKNNVENDKLAQITNERDAALVQSGAIKKSLESIEKERDVLKVERDSLRAERDALKSERDSLKMEREMIKNERDAARKSQPAVQPAPAPVQPAQDARLQARIAELERQLSAADDAADRKYRQQYADTAKITYDEKQRKIDALTTENDALRAQISSSSPSPNNDVLLVQKIAVEHDKKVKLEMTVKKLENELNSFKKKLADLLDYVSRKRS